MAGRNSIYEVFRACRLCGGGGGYKMPIVNLEDELDMRHKIRECVRIEVHRDDKMPPLICELCVDKVNDYFEFLEMCRATDTRTRDRLGLPQLGYAQPGNDGGDCILGVTEPVFVNDDSNDAEPLARQKNKLILGAKGKKSATPTPPPAKKRKSSPIPVISITRSGLKDAKTGLKELKVSLNGSRDSTGSRSSSTTRASRSGRRAPTPPRPASPVSTRRETRRDDSKEKHKKIKHEPDRKKLPPPPPVKKREDSRQRGILKSSPTDDKSLLREKPRPASKREREREKEDPGQAKRVKIAIKSAPAPARTERRAAPPPRAEKRRAASPPRPPPKKKAPEPHGCRLCKMTFSKQPSLTNHLRTAHSPTFTLDKLACNACGEWFRTTEETGTHHRWHKSAAAYVCRLCTAEFKQYHSFSKHFANKQCVPSTEVADMQCPECWLYFPTAPLMEQHRCKGEDGRPGGNCAKCKRKYATYKTLRRHEESCFKPGPKSKGGAVTVSPEIQRRLHPMQVRVARCDPLLTSVKQEKHYDVSHIERTFGLDKSCVYPYISSVRSIKTEPQDYDLSRVKSELTDDFVYEDNFNYESFTDSDSEPELVESEPRLVKNPFAKRKKRKVDALSTLSIKAIFSNRCLGQKKIQRKRLRRLKQEKIEIKTELDHSEIDKETKSEMIESCNGELRDAEERGVFGDIDDEAERDVRSTVDDLIAGLNNADDVATEDGGKTDADDVAMKDSSKADNVATEVSSTAENVATEVSSGADNVATDDSSKADNVTTEDSSKTENVATEDNSKTELSNVASENLNSIAPTEDGEDTETTKDAVDEEMKAMETSNLGNEATETAEKEVVKEIEKDETSAEAEIKDVESKDKETESKVDTDKVEVTEKVDIEREKDEKMDGDDDEFDVNSIFSGALGSTALKSKGELAHADDKTEEASEGKNIKDDAEDKERDVEEKRTKDMKKSDTNVEEVEAASVDEEVEKNPSIDVRLAEDEGKETAAEFNEKRDEQAENFSNELLNKSSEKDDAQDSTQELTQKDDSEESISQKDDQQFDSTEQLVQKDERQIDSTEQSVQKDERQLDSEEQLVSQIDSTEQLVQKDVSQIDSTEQLVQKVDSQIDLEEQLVKKNESQIDSTDNFDQKNDQSHNELSQRDDSQEDSIQYKDDHEMESSQITQKDDLTNDSDKLDDLIPSNKDKSMSDTELDNISDSEMMDDNELMQELDAQIKENTNNAAERDGAKADSGEKSMEPEEKISLDELLMASAEVTKTSDDKLRESMDLDTISDEEFNFDA